jgi:hypothetical protein
MLEGFYSLNIHPAKIYLCHEYTNLIIENQSGFPLLILQGINFLNNGRTGKSEIYLS